MWTGRVKTDDFTFYEVFAHEIKHSYDRDCGENSGNSENFSHIDNTEFSTVYFENLIRTEEAAYDPKIIKRTTYGGKSIYSKSIPKKYRGVTLYQPQHKMITTWTR